MKDAFVAHLTFVERTVAVDIDRTQCELGQAFGDIIAETRGQGFVDITRRVADWLNETGAADGLVTVFLRHTSASLTIQENADPDVLRDLTDALEGLAPQSQHYRHNSEGPDDMPAHIKTMLSSTSLTIPVRSGQMYLGTWQGLYVVEHRSRPHRRTVALHYHGTYVVK